MENKGGPTGNTQNKSGTHHSSNVMCYKCGKMGHISPNCPTNGPRVFAAHIIDEDAAEAPCDNTHGQDDHQGNKDRDESRSNEDDHSSDHPNTPIGSQYESDQEGDPLDQFEEYIEPERSSDEDADIVYI
jgi:hypothetical protein